MIGINGVILPDIKSIAFVSADLTVNFSLGASKFSFTIPSALNQPISQT